VVGIPGFVDGKMRQLSRQLLLRMNIAQLQVVVNDLHTQIEGHISSSETLCTTLIVNLLYIVICWLVLLDSRY